MQDCLFIHEPDVVDMEPAETGDSLPSLRSSVVALLSIVMFSSHDSSDDGGGVRDVEHERFRLFDVIFGVDVE